MKQYNSYYVSLCCLMVGLICAIAALIVAVYPSTVETNVVLYEHRQLYDDWLVQPFIDVILHDARYKECPDNYEPIIYRAWNGTHDVCFQESSGSNNLNIKVLAAKSGQEVENSQKTCSGTLKVGLEAINMTNIGGMLVCGKRDGQNFLESIRVNPETHECPPGYDPCSAETTPSETVCWPTGASKDACPIIDLVVISSKSAQKWIDKGYTVTAGSFQSELSTNLDSKIAFSKTRVRKQTFGSGQPIVAVTLNT